MINDDSSRSGGVQIIDCRDSFTYNVYQLLSKAGAGRFGVIPVDSLDPDKTAVEAERVILSPGPGVPAEYPRIFRLIEKIAERPRPVPVLGICLGHQILSSFFGAEVYNLDRVIHGQPHRISIKADGGLFSGLPDRFTVGLYHSWAVNLGGAGGLELTAESEDGIVMGVRHRSLPFYGIQFHPESFISEYGIEIMRNFLSL